MGTAEAWLGTWECTVDEWGTLSNIRIWLGRRLKHSCGMNRNMTVIQLGSCTQTRRNGTEALPGT